MERSSIQYALLTIVAVSCGGQQVKETPFYGTPDPFKTVLAQIGAEHQGSQEDGSIAKCNLYDKFNDPSIILEAVNKAAMQIATVYTCNDTDPDKYDSVMVLDIDPDGTKATMQTDTYDDACVVTAHTTATAIMPHEWDESRVRACASAKAEKLPSANEFDLIKQAAEIVLGNLEKAIAQFEKDFQDSSVGSDHELFTQEKYEIDKYKSIASWELKKLRYALYGEQTDEQKSALQALEERFQQLVNLYRAIKESVSGLY